MIERHVTTAVKVGSVTIGGGHPVVVQSMTNTVTADAVRTAIQCAELAKAGSEIVRITVDTEDAAKAVPYIREQLDKMDCHVPLVGDFHFNGHRLLSQYPDCAKMLDKYRINPGNVGKGKKRDEQFSTMIEIACQHNKAVRIGANWGSLDQELLARMLDDNNQQQQPLPLTEINRQAVIRSALESAQRAEALGLRKDQIIISCKMSAVQDLIEVYRSLAAQSSYALHLGLTEAGMGSKGIVASTAALAVLLQQGIGDTIRISLTPEPGGARTEEVIVAQEILQTMGLRSFTPMVTACPGCGRTNSTFFQELSQDIQTYLREKMPAWKMTHPGVEEMKVAVMGCIVNGPGESKHADIGISLPGIGEQQAMPVFIDGERKLTLKGDSITEEFKQIIDDYVAGRFSA